MTTSTSEQTTSPTSHHAALTRQLTWAGLRDAARARRNARLERAALEQQLSSYTSETEQNELAAILERYPDDEAVDVRRIVSRLRAA